MIIIVALFINFAFAHFRPKPEFLGDKLPKWSTRVEDYVI